MIFRKAVLIYIISLLSWPFTAVSGETGSLFTKSFSPVVALLGGGGVLNANSSQIFTGTDDILFIYNANNTNNTIGSVGGFLGAEYVFPNANFFTQIGIEYLYFEKSKFTGHNTAGDEPATYTHYNYSFNLNTEQWLASLRLLTTIHSRFHPFVLAGIGVANNHADKFHLSTQESGSINLTPTFSNHTHTNFSYTLGIGVDADIDKHFRIGFGYRFADFGSAALGNGQIALNQYVVPLPFALNTSNTHANLFLAQLSYLI